MKVGPEGQTIIRKTLLTALLGSTKATQRVEIKQMDFAPGQTTDIHDHPCPVVGYIASGSVRFQVEGQDVLTLKAGDAFFEPADTRILHFDNASSTEPMTFIAFYLLGEGENQLIRMIE
jgi:quercetin dioxygenase-like cupin family protein